MTSVSGVSWQIFKTGVLGSKVYSSFKRSEEVKKAPSLWSDIPYIVLHTLHNGIKDEQFNDGSTLTDSLETNGHTLLCTESLGVYLSACFICAFAKFIVLE